MNCLISFNSFHAVANESEKMFHNMTSNMGLPQMTVQTNTPKSDASTRGPEDSASPKEEQIKSVESAPAVTSSLEVNESQEAKESSEKSEYIFIYGCK